MSFLREEAGTQGSGASVQFPVPEGEMPLLQGIHRDQRYADRSAGRSPGAAVRV